MDFLWSPWRYSYLASSGRPGRKGVPEELSAWPGDLGCVFCNMLAAVEYATTNGMPQIEADRLAGIVLRAGSAYICLNRFPYNSGHIMIVPYVHTGVLAELKPATAGEMMALAQQAEKAISKVYSPDGLNLGINLGTSAGAGVAAHLHLHVVPRWNGDANFMTVIAETRVLPETLEKTWERLRNAFSEVSRESRYQELQTAPGANLGKSSSS